MVRSNCGPWVAPSSSSMGKRPGPCMCSASSLCWASSCAAANSAAVRVRTIDRYIIYRVADSSALFGSVRFCSFYIVKTSPFFRFGSLLFSPYC